MSRVQQFLEGLQDYELAFLYKYKYATYFDNTQAAIRQELDKRKLDSFAIDNFVKDIEFNSTNTGCPRCNSKQHLTQQVEFTNTDRYTGLDGLAGRAEYTSRSECAVCGYLLYDGNEAASGSSIWQLLKKVLFPKEK